MTGLVALLLVGSSLANPSPEAAAALATASDSPALLWTAASFTGAVNGPGALSADGQTLFINSIDGSLRALSTSDGAELWSFSHGSTNAFEYRQIPPLLSPDGATLFLLVNGHLHAVSTANGDGHGDVSGGDNADNDN